MVCPLLLLWNSKARMVADQHRFLEWLDIKDFDGATTEWYLHASDLRRHYHQSAFLGVRCTSQPYLTPVIPSHVSQLRSSKFHESRNLKLGFFFRILFPLPFRKQCDSGMDFTIAGSTCHYNNILTNFGEVNSKPALQ